MSIRTDSYYNKSFSTKRWYNLLCDITKPTKIKSMTDNVNCILITCSMHKCSNTITIFAFKPHYWLDVEERMILQPSFMRGLRVTEKR